MGEVKSIEVLELEINKINKLIGKLINKENNIVKNTIKINMYRSRVRGLEEELCSKRRDRDEIICI